VGEGRRKVCAYYPNGHPQGLSFSWPNIARIKGLDRSLLKKRRKRPPTTKREKAKISFAPRKHLPTPGWGTTHASNKAKKEAAP